MTPIAAGWSAFNLTCATFKFLIVLLVAQKQDLISQKSTTTAEDKTLLVAQKQDLISALPNGHLVEMTKPLGGASPTLGVGRSLALGGG